MLGVEQLPDGLLDVARVQHDVQPALGGQLVAPLRHQRHLMRLHRLRDAHHLRRRRHLDVEMRGHRARQNLDVAILNVPPVAAQMDGDPLRARQLADDRRRDRIRLVALARFTDGGDVIDVDGETHARRLAERRFSPQRHKGHKGILFVSFVSLW